MKLIVEGDRHIRSKPPYSHAHKAYTEWVIQQPWNNEDTIWFSEGDWLDKSYPDPEEYGIALDFFSRTNFNRYIIQAGNHEYSRPKDRYSIAPFEWFSNVEILYKETVLEFENTKILTLPFYYPYLREDVGRMEEHYSNLHEIDMGKETYDYIFGHLYFMDTFGSYCDMSNLKARQKKLFGHDHTIQSNSDGEYIGSPMPTSYTQRGQQGRLLLIDLETTEWEWIEVPMFLDFATISYPDDLPETNSMYTIWDIENVVDKEAAWKHYHGKGGDPFVVREYRIRKSESESDDSYDEDESNWSLDELLNKYFSTNEVEDNVRKIVKGKLQKTL